MKILLNTLSLLFLIAIISGISSILWLNHEFKKPGPQSQVKEIIISRGTNIGSVAETLRYEGIITQPLLFKIAGRLTGQARKIKAGEYEILPHISIKDTLSQFEKGQTIKRRFTIPEGLTSFEVVRLLRKIDDLSGEITMIPSEGSLLPNTYDYQRGEKRSDIIERLQENMISVTLEECHIDLDKASSFSFASLLSLPCEELPLKTIRDVLTLASIVEKETAQASERAKIAGVFINRLNKNMPLQTDPTVIYAITKGKHKNNGKGPLGRRLLRKDLSIHSPYNTYIHPGLPPGPIANPGREAIKAVLNPEAHDDLYFVANGTGGHAFAGTLKAHNRNVAQWRKIRKASKSTSK